ncbi:molecular chaperone HtpG [Humidesulfovibrio mexicanus]|uniref:Chaperone protein HtpG n=1 Tax=Humidesulfovibrio mexicanus TaxID=147047 RepID=A0A238ZYM5_9BACT|nr:molecular chaperone HtpG [Humidesulfovibrio mexicanus]SNR88101.1 molecular chaperone HtpG [Humidesulfovibrio mexicanus]
MSTHATYEFKAEIKQLLEILVHSLYTDREIFLRELVSNASDALDKLRITAAEATDEAPLEIRIEADKDKKTLAISDNGIGMTEAELVENIGTIAHSGSAAFLKAMKEAGNSADGIIGRFGVGFYSVYMVAQSVRILTRSHREGATPVEWISEGQGAYSIRELSGEEAQAVGRGTRIEISLKDDLAEQFTEADTLRHIIRKHSNFLSFPIIVDGERVNTVPALWREPKFQITKEQYKEFYSFLTYDLDEPMDTLHVSVDAPVQFNALCFIPKKSKDFMGFDREDWGLDLYVRRVLIQRQNKDLIPQYLMFARGVVDTEDLPLNISRETLQDNRLIRKINTTLTKQILSQLAKMAEDKDAYATFWREHSRVFKAGYMDFANREAFAALLRFNSSSCEAADELVSLDEYISRAKPDQKQVYFAFGPSREALKLNPHLELFRKKGVEVLYLYEPIDEFVMDALHTYKEFTLTPAELAKPDDLAKLPDVEQAPEEAAAAPEKDSLEALLVRFKDILGDGVADVRATSRLTGSPCCLVNPDGHTTSSMDKIMRAMNHDASVPKKVMELNPTHPLVRNLADLHQADPQDPFVEQAARQLFESALLLEGYLSDPHALVGRVQDLLSKASGWYAKSK